MKFKVLLLDTKPSNPNHYICLAIYFALQKHPKIEAVYLASFGDAITLAQINHCNLFFAFDGEGLNTEICRRLKEICGYAIVWNTEDPYELPVNLANADLFDHVFTNDSASVWAYGGKATHLPLAASEEFQYHPVLENAACRYDLFFAGTAWPNRVQLISKLANLIDGSLRIKLAMPTNQYLPSIKDIPFPPSFYSWRTSNIEFARFANRSRITLGLHRDFSTTPGAPTVALTPGPRIFEVAMAGGFQLVDQALAETENLFLLGQEIISFNGEKDCLEKVDHYINHSEERVTIAKAAQERALKVHTYESRIDVIISSLPKLAVNKIELSLSPPVDQRNRLLLVTHNFIQNSEWGGVEIYQEILRKNLKDEFEIYFYAPIGASKEGCCQYGLFDSDLNLVEEYSTNQSWNSRILSCEDRERFFSTLLIKYKIDLIHFQHLLLHTPSMPLIANALGIPCAFTWHDYYGACVKFNLIGMYGAYCGVEDMPLSGCDACLSQFATPGGQSIRREFYARMFEKMNVIHVATQEVKDRVMAVYPTLIDSQFVIRGIPHSQAQLNLGGHRDNKRIQAVILGNFTISKGAGQLLHVLQGLKDVPIDIHIHGRIDDDAIEAVEKLDCPNAFFHGAYLPDETPKILANKDIAIFSPVWPETYSLTLSEVVLSGVVPIAPDLGAFSARLKDSVNGFLYENRNIGHLTSLVRELVYSPEQIKRVRMQLSSILTESSGDHVKWIRDIYHRMINKSSRLKVEEGDELSVTAFILKDCGILLNHPVWTEANQSIQAVQNAEIAQDINNMYFLKRIFRYFQANGLLATIKRLKQVRVKLI